MNTYRLTIYHNGTVDFFTVRADSPEQARTLYTGKGDVTQVEETA